MMILAIGLTVVLFCAAWLAIVGWPISPGALVVGFAVTLIAWIAAMTS